MPFFIVFNAIFSWKFIFEYFSKICIEKSSFVNIEQEWRVLYMEANVHIWSYLAEVLLEWELFQTKFVNKIKIHIFVQ